MEKTLWNQTECTKKIGDRTIPVSEQLRVAQNSKFQTKNFIFCSGTSDRLSASNTMCFNDFACSGEKKNFFCNKVWRLSFLIALRLWSMLFILCIFLLVAAVIVIFHHIEFLPFYSVVHALVCVGLEYFIAVKCGQLTKIQEICWSMCAFGSAEASPCSMVVNNSCTETIAFYVTGYEWR